MEGRRSGWKVRNIQTELDCLLKRKRSMNRGGKGNEERKDGEEGQDKGKGKIKIE